jgi:hypothetical protein
MRHESRHAAHQVDILGTGWFLLALMMFQFAMTAPVSLG